VEAAPRRARSAILPIGIAVAVLAGILILLASGGDENEQAPAAAAAQDSKAEAAPTTPARAPEDSLAPSEAAAQVPSEQAAEGSSAPSPAPAEGASEASREEGRDEKGASEVREEARDEKAASEDDEDGKTVTVTVIMSPEEEAELYRKGRRIGRSGVKVKIPVGGKRTYEVVAKGYRTRQVTLDDSRKRVRVVLKPEKPKE